MCNCATMRVLDKIKEMVAPSTSEMFNAYVKYCTENGLSLKVRSGKPTIIDSSGNSESYDSWDELNEKYKLFPTMKDEALKKCEVYMVDKHWSYKTNLLGHIVIFDENEKSMGVYRNWFDFALDNNIIVRLPKDYIGRGQIVYDQKVYAYGSKTNPKYIAEQFNLLYDVDVFDANMFGAPGRIHFISSVGSLCSTTNDMVIDLIERDPTWYKIEPPTIIEVTRKDIAQWLGVKEDEFIIVD